MLAGPLLAGTSWTGTRGASGDVASASDYLGTKEVTVPAFQGPRRALGDPYGSRVRTVWWVYGVGPVKAVVAHSGGSGAPFTTSMLQPTNQVPKPPPDANCSLVKIGMTGTYR